MDRDGHEVPHPVVSVSLAHVDAPRTAHVRVALRFSDDATLCSRAEASADTRKRQVGSQRLGRPQFTSGP
jgi:hypothetical protein